MQVYSVPHTGILAFSGRGKKAPGQLLYEEEFANSEYVGHFTATTRHPGGHDRRAKAQVSAWSAHCAPPWAGPGPVRRMLHCLSLFAPSDRVVQLSALSLGKGFSYA